MSSNPGQNGASDLDSMMLRFASTIQLDTDRNHRPAATARKGMLSSKAGKSDVRSAGGPAKSIESTSVWPDWCYRLDRWPPLYKHVAAICKSGTPPPARIDTAKLYPILVSTGLPHDVLREVWSATNKEQPGALTDPELAACLAIIAVLQSGRCRSCEHALSLLCQMTSYRPIPQFSVPINVVDTSSSERVLPSASTDKHEETVAADQVATTSIATTESDRYKALRGLSAPDDALPTTQPTSNSVIASTTPSIPPVVASHIVEDSFADFSSAFPLPSTPAAPVDDNRSAASTSIISVTEQPPRLQPAVSIPTLSSSVASPKTDPVQLLQQPVNSGASDCNSPHVGMRPTAAEFREAEPQSLSEIGESVFDSYSVSGKNSQETTTSAPSIDDLFGLEFSTTNVNSITQIQSISTPKWEIDAGHDARLSSESSCDSSAVNKSSPDDVANTIIEHSLRAFTEASSIWESVSDSPRSISQLMKYKRARDYIKSKDSRI